MLSEYHKGLIIEQVSKYGDIDSDLIDIQEIDSSLTYEEAKNELYEKFGIYEEAPECYEYDKYLERKQEEQFKRYAQKHYNRHRGTKNKAVMINNTIYLTSLKTNFLWVDRAIPERYHRKIKKPLYKRFNLIRKKNSISFNLAQALLKCPDSIPLT